MDVGCVSLDRASGLRVHLQIARDRLKCRTGDGLPDRLAAIGSDAGSEQGLIFWLTGRRVGGAVEGAAGEQVGVGKVLGNVGIV